MQDNTESNYELDFEILILIEPDTDGIMYHSEFYNKKMVMKYFAWFRDADNMENFNEYCKLLHLNFEDVPFTIDGKKCKIPTKNFSTTPTGQLRPSINDICQYLNKRGVYVKNMTQNEFQNYLADYFMFPLFEAERIQQKEKSFEEIFRNESRIILRTEGLTYDKKEFVVFLTNTSENFENMTDEAFKEIVVDYFYLKRHQRNTTIKISPAPPAEEQEKKVKIKIPTFIIMLEVAETINKEENFLPKDWINRTNKLLKYKKAIFDRFGFDYSESTIKNNFDKNLTDRHRLKVIELLIEYGRMDLAKQYQIQYKSNR